MGSAKKKSSRQADKQKRIKQAKGKKGRGEARAKPTGRTVTLENTDFSDGQLRDGLKKMNAITPYAVATQFNIKLSTAKRLLRTMMGQGVLQLVARSRNVQLYKFEGS
jgi:small subunit ribosomal protein S25e